MKKANGRVIALIAAFLSIFILFSFIFWPKIMGIFFEHYFNAYCKRCWDAELYVESISEQDGHWILEKPMITTAQSFESGGKQVLADRIIIKDTWHFFQREIDLDVNIINPRINLGFPTVKKPSIEENISSSIDLTLPHLPLISFKGKLLIDRGILNISNDEKNENNQGLPFSFQSEWGTHTQGAMALCLNDQDSSDKILLIFKEQQGTLVLDLDCQKASCKPLLQALSLYYPQLNDWSITRGKINGHLRLKLASRGKIPYLSGDAAIEQLDIFNEKMHISGHLPQLKLDLKPDSPVSESLAGSLTVPQPSTIAFLKGDKKDFEIAELKGVIHFFNNGEKDVTFDGFLQKKEARFPLSLSTHHATKDPLNSLHLLIETNIDQISRLASTSIQENIRNRFSQHALTLDANVNLSNSNVHLEGFITLKEDVRDDDRLNFQCDIGPASPEIPKTMNDFIRHWSDISLLDDIDSNFENFVLFIPFVALDKSRKSSGISITNGSFHGEQLSLEKYLKGFFPKGSIYGLADISGQFNHYQISIDAAIQEFSINHPSFVFTINDKDAEKQDIRSSIDLKTGGHNTNFFVKNAAYQDKKNGLKFADIKAEISFKSFQMVAKDVEAFSDGIYFAGEISADLNRFHQGFADIQIRAQQMEGKVSSLKTFMSHFKVSPLFLDCPLEGNMAFRKDGGQFNFSVTPENVEFDSCFNAVLTDGFLTCDHKEIALRDLSSNIDFNQKNSSLEFSDIQGSLLVGPLQMADEYIVAGDLIRISGQPNQQAEFDLWIGDKTRDVIRIAGKTKPINKNSSHTHFAALELDHSLSHFWDVHPQEFELVIRDWKHIETFKLKMALQLSSLFKDLQKIAKHGFVLFTRDPFKSIKNIQSADGFFSVDIQYNDLTSQLSFLAQGQDLSIDQHKYKNILLKGSKKDKSWNIDQLQINRLSLAADLTELEGMWKVNFLGLQYGESILAGLEGNYFPNKHSFKGKINLLEIQAEKLNEFPDFQSFYEKFQPKGRLNATGSLEFQLIEERPKWKAEAQLDVSLKNFESLGIRLEDVSHIPCNFLSNKEMTIGNIQTALFESGRKHAQINIPKTFYDFPNHEIIVEGLNFLIPGDEMPWLASKIKNILPKALHPLSLELISKTSKKDPFEGSLSITRAGQHRTVHLTLNDGVYLFNGAEYSLSNLSIAYNPLEFNFNAEYQLRNLLFHLSLKSRSPDLEYGEFLLSSQNGLRLSAIWHTDPKIGILLQKAEGNLDGISFNLYRPAISTSKDIELYGELGLDLNMNMRFLPENLRNLLAHWQTTGTYALKGFWAIPIENLFSWQDKLHFQGAIDGKNMVVNGFQIDSLSATLEMTPKKASLEGIQICDISGKIESEHMEITHSAEKSWIISSPLITLSRFRPSLMRNLNIKKDVSENTLTIKQMELKNFIGDLSNSLTFTGHGRIYCANPPKRERPNSLINVSSDLLIKLGLDLSALSPVSGAIDYEMKEGKMYFKKFKDMYSTGRVSKFYLPKQASTPSYIDFNGNINLQVRMKQYNLLYKIAELFTINIGGTLWEPSYNLYKEP